MDTLILAAAAVLIIGPMALKRGKKAITSKVQHEQDVAYKKWVSREDAYGTEWAESHIRKQYKTSPEGRVVKRTIHIS